MAEINYRFTAEKLTRPDSNPQGKLREKYRGKVWEFCWPDMALNLEESYEILRKAIKSAPKEEAGFELFINGRDQTITLTPYSQRSAKRKGRFDRYSSSLIDNLNRAEKQCREHPPKNQVYR